MFPGGLGKTNEMNDEHRTNGSVNRRWRKEEEEYCDDNGRDIWVLP